MFRTPQRGPIADNSTTGDNCVLLISHTICSRPSLDVRYKLVLPLLDCREWSAYRLRRKWTNDRTGLLVFIPGKSCYAIKKACDCLSDERTGVTAQGFAQFSNGLAGCRCD